VGISDLKAWPLKNKCPEPPMQMMMPMMTEDDRAGKENEPSNQGPCSITITMLSSVVHRSELRASTILRDGVWISGI